MSETRTDASTYSGGEALTRWWGYRHVNGNYQVKRHWGDAMSAAAMQDAYSSPFVDEVCQPFEARGRQQALDRCKAILKRSPEQKTRGGVR